MKDHSQIQSHMSLWQTKFLIKYVTCSLDQIVSFSYRLENRQIYKGVVWFIKRGVIVGETLVWWKGLAKELELDIETLDEGKEETRL